MEMYREQDLRQCPALGLRLHHRASVELTVGIRAKLGLERKLRKHLGLQLSR